MNTQKVTKKTGPVGKPRRKSHPVNNAKVAIMDTLGPISPEVAIQDSCLRAYLKLGSIRAVADSLGISVGLAHRHITEGSAYMRKAASLEHRAAVLGLVEERVNYLWQTVNGTLRLCVASGQVDKIASLIAVSAKLCELTARFHGLGGETTPSTEESAARLAETARRLALIGPHSRAKEMAPAIRAALSLTQSKSPESVTSMPEKTEMPPPSSPSSGTEVPERPAQSTGACWVACPP